MENLPKRLYRSRTDKIIAGVCGGMGEYFNMDPLIFRIIFAVLVFAGGGGVLLYILLAIIIPKAPWPGQPEPGVDPKGQFHDFVADVKGSAQHWAAEARRSPEFQKHRNNSRAWFGMIVVIVGALLLVNKLFPQNWIRWDVLWPVAIIIVGISILSRGHRS